MSKRSRSTSSSEVEALEDKPKQTVPQSPHKKVKTAPTRRVFSHSPETTSEWADWPAPRDDIAQARLFIQDIARHHRRVLLVPDKDADGLSAGLVLHKTLRLLGVDPANIHVHVLSKGTNVHSASEIATMEALVEEQGIERAVVLDQGSRPGAILGNLKGAGLAGLMVIDHHQSKEFPPDATILTACNTSPIATTSLLTYLMCLPLHPQVRHEADWTALMGVIGDLGPGIKWGQPPWPAHIGETAKRYGSKTIADAVAAINAPRRTAEYNVKKAWDILLAASEPKQVATNAFLKLCRLDVNQEVTKWQGSAPRFSADGKVALVRVETGFQVHPVIATRWAGTLKKARTLKMVMCANTGFNPDPNKISFSCRISASLRSLPEDERPNLIELLKEYGNSIEGFTERVGEDFARGHKEATGGIIAKSEFEHLLKAMGIDETPTPKKIKPSTKTGKGKVIDPGQKNGIQDFFAPKR